MCSRWNRKSDNNTQFQLNSLMCDLYLRNCFLHQSGVFGALQQHVCVYADRAYVFQENMQTSWITSHCLPSSYSSFTTWNDWATAYVMYWCCSAFLTSTFILLSCCAIQTWRTSRRREEAQWGFAKARGWSCCAAPRLIPEVRLIQAYGMIYIWHSQTFTVYWTRTNIQSLLVSYRNVGCDGEPFLICSAFICAELKSSLCSLPSHPAAVCLCRGGQWSEPFYSGQVHAPDSQQAQGKTLACRLTRPSVAGVLPGWVMELRSKAALFASHQPFASMTLSIAALLTTILRSQDGLFAPPDTYADCNSMLLEHLDAAHSRGHGGRAFSLHFKHWFKLWTDAGVVFANVVRLKPSCCVFYFLVFGLFCDVSSSGPGPFNATASTTRVCVWKQFWHV